MSKQTPHDLIPALRQLWQARVERERELREALIKAGNQLLRYGDPRGDEAIFIAKHKEQSDD